MPDALAPDPFTAMAAQLTPKRAVSYIRVSTREQAQRGGSEEGFSLPAQREANKRKAQSMGALVVKEFADRGESARSANRPELQKMLAYLKEDGGIDYVIVHKLDRLARNRADDVEINRAFEEAGLAEVTRGRVTNYTYWDYQKLRFPRNEGMRIDFVYASPALAGHVTGAAIDRDERKGKGASDHVPVIVELD